MLNINSQNMNRRSFFQKLSMAGAAFLLAPHVLAQPILSRRSVGVHITHNGTEFVVVVVDGLTGERIVHKHMGMSIGRISVSRDEKDRIEIETLPPNNNPVIQWDNAKAHLAEWETPSFDYVTGDGLPVLRWDNGASIS